jgi:hypothetical protein
MIDCNREQLEALLTVRDHPGGLPGLEIDRLK